MADPDDFDLDQSIAQSWAMFAGRLAEVLSMMDESGELTLRRVDAPDADADLVHFTCDASGHLTVTTRVPAAMLAGGVASLEASGWAVQTPGSAPVVLALTASQDEAVRFARAVVELIADVHGVLHPVFLAPDQLSEILATGSSGSGPAATLDDLSVTAPEPGRTGAALDDPHLRPLLARSREHLATLVGDELERVLGHRPMRDAEGDFCVRWGSTMVFVRPAADLRDITIFAPVVHDLEGRSRAAEVLGDLNAELGRVKFVLQRDRVFATVTVMADPFVPAHLVRALGLLGEVADGVDDHLAAKLRGRTTFEDGA